MDKKAQLKEALEIGLEAAHDVAAETHQAYAGYKPHRHAYVDECVRKIEAAIAVLDQVVPDAVPDTSQEWARHDGAIAFHLIERHADNWNEAGDMMEAWGKARFAPTGFVAVPVEAYLWLMGMGKDSFAEDRSGKFWWRSAFNERAGLDMVEVYEKAKKSALDDISTAK